MPTETKRKRGRPKIYDKRRETLGTLIDGDIMDRARAVLRRKGWSISYFIREAIQKLVAEGESEK